MTHIDTPFHNHHEPLIDEARQQFFRTDRRGQRPLPGYCHRVTVGSG